MKAKSLRPKNLEKPCHKIGYCPYGVLVEQFPLPDEPNDKSCEVFGHECPVFHVAEIFVDKEE